MYGRDIPYLRTLNLVQFLPTIWLLISEMPIRKDKHLSTCAVCAGPHLTELHTCTLDTCRQGILCTHPSIKCVNCDAPHKATDPECRTRTKIQLDPKLNGRSPAPSRAWRFCLKGAPGQLKNGTVVQMLNCARGEQHI
jgi:hypothetical protein